MMGGGEGGSSWGRVALLAALGKSLRDHLFGDFIVVAGLQVFVDADQSLLQGIVTARVKHLLLDFSALGTPKTI